MTDAQWFCLNCGEFLKAAGWIRAYTSMNAWSWGEVLEVIGRASEESDSKIMIESRSRFPLTLIDWAKNKRNTVAFVQLLVTTTPQSSSQGEKSATVEDIDARP